MFSRRDMMAISGAALAFGPRMAWAAARSSLPVPPGNRLGFAVTRKGTVLGNHVVSFAPTGDTLHVSIAVDLALKFGPITLYRYHHRGSELWADGQIAAIESATNDDGTRYQVSGRRGADGFAVEGTKAARYIAPPEALPANHWNRAMLDGPFINTQDGRLMHPHVSALGIDQIPTLLGRPLRARRFALTGDVQLDTWYEPDTMWAGLRFAAHDGSQIRYERRDT